MVAIVKAMHPPNYAFEFASYIQHDMKYTYHRDRRPKKEKSGVAVVR